MTSPNVLERAFELARSGECRDVDEMERRLSREGYTDVSGHFRSQSLRRQLRELMRTAGVTAG